MKITAQKIHPSAVIDARAKIDSSVEIGPHCVVGPEVMIGAGTRLISQVVIDGRTTIGQNNIFYPGACIGFPPQAKPFEAGTRVVIGNDNIFREHTTVHTGTKEAGTVLGDQNVMMAGSHVGHDCQVGDHVTMANTVALGGHVIIEDRVVIGGLAAVHQYCRIGKLAMVGGLTKTTQDVLPFSLVDGRPARLSGVNLIGLRRGGFSTEAIRDIRRAMRLLYYSGARFREAQEAVRVEFSGNADVEHLLRFIGQSKRGVVRRRDDRSGGSGEP